MGEGRGEGRTTARRDTAMAHRDIDVVAAGHICVDITPSFGEVSGTSLAEILRPGGLLQVGPATISTGGTVSNTGLALRRLGLNVSLMGKCGDDLFGQAILDILRREAPGAEAGMRVVPGERTSYTIVIVLPGIDRMFFHCPGCNDTFGAEDVDMDIVRQARLFHFGYPPAMKRMYSSGGRELATLLRKVSGVGTGTSLDLTLPDPNTEAGRADWPAILSEALPYTDIFLPSLEELLFMLRRERFEELIAGPGIVNAFTADDLRALAGDCLGMGARIVVIKCGHAGAYLRTAASLDNLSEVLNVTQEWEGVEMFEPTCKVEHIVSAAGSGDNAIAGFLAAFLHGEPPAWCMAVLAAVGAQNLSVVDTISGVLSWEETIAQVQANPEKNPLPERLASAFGVGDLAKPGQ